MKRYFPSQAVHSLYLLVIAALAFVLVQKRLSDGESILFNTIMVTQGFARIQGNDFSLLMLRGIERYSYGSAYGRSGKPQNSANALNLRCDTLILLVETTSVTTDLLETTVSWLLDSLRDYATYELDSIRIQALKHGLLQDDPNGWPARLAIMRRSQKEMLYNTVAINLLQLKNIRLSEYLNGVSFCDIQFDVFKPVCQPEILCPTASQKFTSNVFLSSYFPSIELSRWRRGKVWVNKQEAPIQNGKAEFSTIFNAPGLQAFHIRVEQPDVWADSLAVYEKTYWVHVRP